MKIAFLVGEFPVLSETFILNQIVALIERGHEVSVFAERRSLDAVQHADVAKFSLLDRTRFESLPGRFPARVAALPRIWRQRACYWRALDVVHHGSLAASLRLVWSVSLFEGHREFDVVLCHFGALGLKAVQLRDIGALSGRIVTAFHGDDIVNYPRRFPGNHYAPLFARGDLFLPISARWNDALVKMGCQPERIRVHRMGVELGDTVEARQTNTPLRILTVGRLVEKKGMADALQALAHMAMDFRYTIVGDGPLRSELELLTRQLDLGGRVHFAGARTRQQVGELLRQSDIFLAPSVTARDGDIEGMPVTIMEAMAAALPVVSTVHSAIPELITNGINGVLVPEHDIVALSDCLARLASDAGERQRLGYAARQVIARDYDIRVLTDQLEALFLEFR